MAASDYIENTNTNTSGTLLAILMINMSNYMFSVFCIEINNLENNSNGMFYCENPYLKITHIM